MGFGKLSAINKERPTQKNVLITNYTEKGTDQAMSAGRRMEMSAPNCSIRSTYVK